MLALLLSFNEKNHTQTVQGMAEHLGVPISSVYRYVAQLREFGLLEEAEFGGYRVSLRAEGLARAARSASSGLESIAGPVLSSLVEHTNESALIIRRLGHSIVATHLEHSPHPVRLAFERGVLMSLHQGAAARVILAALGQREREAYYEAIGKFTHESQLPTHRELQAVREAGWAESFGQVEDGIWGVAAAIQVGPTTIAAVSVAGPLYRLDDDKRAAIIEAVIAAARTINTQLNSEPGAFPAHSGEIRP